MTSDIKPEILMCYEFDFGIIWVDLDFFPFIIMYKYINIIHNLNLNMLISCYTIFFVTCYKEFYIVELNGRLL